MSTARIKQLFIIICIFNVLVALLLMGTWLATSVSSVKALFASPTYTITITDTPTATFTLTDTPLPSATVSPFPTPTVSLEPSKTPTSTSTPIPFSEGPIIIGYSVENRPLEVYRFGTGMNERLIVAGMHGGNEYNTIQLADELIAHILSYPELIPPETTLFILRDLNPDGEARAHNYSGRANAHNVDLNRNWDANWQKDWPRENCWTFTYVSAGTSPGSEPETTALMNFIRAHSFQAIINYHSAALGIFPGGLPPEASTLRFADAVAAVTDYPYPPVNVGCTYTGGFTDWADEQGIPALDMELTNHTDTDFVVNLRVLEVLLTWEP
jgi:hypothetical protein